MSTDYTPRYPGVHGEKVSTETLDQIRERGCEAGRAAETEDTFRLRRLFNELEFLAYRLAMIQAAVNESNLKPDPWPCPECKSNTVFDGMRIHYTDCRTGLG